jgi:hypothetical protein
MGKVTVLLAFGVCTTASALFFACGDNPSSPAKTPTGGPAPAVSSAGLEPAKRGTSPAGGSSSGGGW